MPGFSSWIWLELLVVGVFVCWTSGGPKGWKRQPLLLGGAALVFLVGLQPALDAAARHSVWLHCLQSALIHHLAPVLLLFAAVRESPVEASFKKEGKGVRIWVAIVFGAMSGVWMLPQLHQRLMDDAALYALMKWAMALSGLWLCRVMGRYCQRADVSLRQQWCFSLAVALPQVLVGVMLLFSPVLYSMHGRGAMSAQLDQGLGGVLICLSALVLLWADRVLHRKPQPTGSAGGAGLPVRAAAPSCG